jgi:hypothetical protein
MLAVAELDVGIKQFDHFQMIFLIFRKIVIYVLDPEPDSVFVITAYELVGKPLKAYQLRGRRKRGK